MSESRTPKEDVLIAGLDDWIYASWVTNSARRVTGQAHLRTFTIGLIAELLVEGLMLAGDAGPDGHHPWPCSPGEAIERITREWLTEWGDDVPTPGAIVWLSNTQAGNKMAEDSLAREGEVC